MIKIPVPCKNPKYAYKNDVRLTFCKNKVVEAKSKRYILLRNKYKRKIYKGPEGGFYYLKNNKKVYV